MTDLIPLEQAHCLPRKGSDHKLGEARLAELLPQVPGWELAELGTAITRTFRFADYYRTLAFVNALAWIAHREEHHPDLGVHYDRVVVRYSTHDVGGLSENDFICAAKAAQLYDQGATP
ncbi:4a-hydroxytetrahydrobiopterin dehydratase [Xanthomonas sp. NCPPB 2865]|uniref:4a-hydroxytetrahydrobiopterin dehydratase n=1 Tax=Xanthomonas TaxID=338 RepID=UPI0016095DCF|nr:MULTISPECIES: 4a-hydroxytetrahydrobiopterin dehydratase [Xanthomonas]MBB5674062.1 4a-hydroxytetrahydrobiopterin dehydratase [Xanthomonas arboricola]